MNNWGGSVTAHDDDGQTGRNILRRWQDCRTPGAPIPSYEAVVLGSLGRLADRAALVTTRNGQAARILWAGQEFGAWLAQGSEGPSAEPCPSETVPVDALPIELREPVGEMVAAALGSGQPAYSRCDRLDAGVVTSTRLVGVPLDNRWGEPFVLIGFDGASVRTELVQAMFTATDQGILALSTIRDAAGHPSISRSSPSTAAPSASWSGPPRSCNGSASASSSRGRSPRGRSRRSPPWSSGAGAPPSS